MKKVMPKTKKVMPKVRTMKKVMPKTKTKKMMPKTKTNEAGPGTPKAKTVGKEWGPAAGKATPMPKTPETKSPLVPSPTVMPKEPWQRAHLHIPADTTIGYWIESSLGVHWDPKFCYSPAPNIILGRIWKMKARDVMKEIILCAHARAATPEEVRAGLAATPA